MTSVLSPRAARAVLDALDEGIVVVAGGRLAACNASAARILATTRNALCGAPSLSARWGVLDAAGRPLAPDDQPAARATRQGAPVLGTVLGVYRADGAFVWLRVHAHPLGAARGDAAADRDGPAVVLTFVDVTAERAADAAVDVARRRFALLAARAPVGIFETDASGACTFANARFAALLGVDAPDAGRDGWTLALDPHDREALYNGWAAAVERRQAYRHVCRVAGAGGAHAPSAAGAAQWVALTLDPICGADGRVLGFLGAADDVTAEQRALAALRDAANRDTLTGLLNRRGFEAEAGRRLADARRSAGPYALFYADVDRLKEVNDRRGHAAGDAALQMVGAALRAAFRDEEVIARLGGDEFVVLAAVGGSDPRQLRERLAACLTALGTAEDSGAPLTASVGVARELPGAPSTLDALLADADAALYQIKRARRGARDAGAGDAGARGAA